MESNELLKSLAELEDNLNKIESARKQVESTVSASTELLKMVGIYVSSVEKLCKGLQVWEKNLNSREASLSTAFETSLSRLNSACAGIQNNFATKVDISITDFKNKTENTAKKFEEQNTKLKESVPELDKLRDEIKKANSDIQSIENTLTQISNDLKKSQANQDVVLNDIKLKVENIPATINGYIKNIIAALKQDLTTILNTTNTKIDSQDVKIGNIKSELSQVNTLCQKNKTALGTLQTSIGTITTAIAKSKDEKLKAIKINRLIIIGGIVLLALLQYWLK